MSQYFINEVMQYPPLWDTSDKHYLKLLPEGELMDKVATALHMTCNNNNCI